MTRGFTHIPDRFTIAPLPAIPLDSASYVPLYRQIYEFFRSSILNKDCAPGTRLPSTRELAKTLMVSRNTIVNAYDQLFAEGYLEAQQGAGTYVTRSLPDDMINARLTPCRTVRLSSHGRSISKRGELMTTTAINASPNPTNFRPFWPGVPALEEFPIKIWERIITRYLGQPSHRLIGHGEPEGYQPLREAIATYLGAARAVQCSADQIIITCGRQQAFDLAARVLSDPDDAAWVEDPGYVGARAALTAAGIRLVAVPMDDEGLRIDAGRNLCPDARLAMVSPSHQYPLGITMSISRRLALLEWASQADAWILEDDYDSEYRYTGRPLSALQGLDQEGRVVYIGTFSKVMFPALRIGYLVVPADKVDRFRAGRAILSRFSPMIEQAALSDFILEGHFARHLLRMRSLYRERQQLLKELLESELTGMVEVKSLDAGFHLIARLSPDLDAQFISSSASAYGVDALPLSAFRLNKEDEDQALVLGYAGYNPSDIRAGVERLSRAFRDANLRSVIHRRLTRCKITSSPKVA